MDSPSSINTRQRSVRGSRPNPRVCCQRHGSGWECLGTGDPSGLRGSSPQALTLFGRVKLITWRLSCPSLGEWRRSPRYFWQIPGTCARPYLKKALCLTCSFGGARNKYHWPYPRDTITCDTTCVEDRQSLPHWTLSFLLTNYCLTKFTCILFLLLEYICFSINIFVFSVSFFRQNHNSKAAVIQFNR